MNDPAITSVANRDFDYMPTHGTPRNRHSIASDIMNPMGPRSSPIYAKASTKIEPYASNTSKQFSNYQSYAQKFQSAAAGERDVFLFRCLKALEVARTAQEVIEAEEAHALIRLKEEELAVEILQAEVEDIRSRWKSAFYQVIDIQKALSSYGIAPPIAPMAPAFTANQAFNRDLADALNRESPPLPPSPPLPQLPALPSSPTKSIRSHSPRSVHSPDSPPPSSSPVQATSSESAPQPPPSSPTPSNPQSIKPDDLMISETFPRGEGFSGVTS